MPVTTPAERPVIFSGDSVRAILAGRKAQTRRVIVPQPRMVEEDTASAFEGIGETDWFGRRAPNTYRRIRCPFGGEGNWLWVRETLVAKECAYGRKVAYAADGNFCRGNRIEYAIPGGGYHVEAPEWEWSRPSLSPAHMPRWASRLTLEVTGVRVERVQEISNKDIEREGVDLSSALNDRTAERDKWRGIFARAWDALNAKRGFPWASNPWVWVVSFRRVPAEGGRAC